MRSLLGYIDGSANRLERILYSKLLSRDGFPKDVELREC